MDFTSWPKKWNDASIGDIAAMWPKKWRDASLRDIATLPEFARPRPWPMLGMLAVGLVAGAALGGYAVSQRAQMKRLATYARGMSDEPAAGDRDESVEPVSTSARSNHRRKAVLEV